ncbi:heme-binding protein [Pelomonas cellulosilytica]|uniref:Heme-binding protein n=1 Tax=Pelomonas cellulosilytica TaxID=2906762 RepID=A0ABS8XPK2_9BURK|nr:heme-binding protein [Pelomonas sp. P8]MCE4553670.1 heme-binding protein [Pelomonas sp. P8]
MDLTAHAPATAAACAAQEAALVLDRLTAPDALSIGLAIIALAEQAVPGRPIALQLETDEHPLFVYFMDGTNAGNADWIAMKKNVVRSFGRSSFRVRLEHLERDVDFNTETGLDPQRFRAEGGAVPLVVRGQGRVGTLIVSGLHGWEDHALAVLGLQQWLQVRAA